MKSKNRTKKQRLKGNIIKNFFFAIKIIGKKDKLSIFYLFIYTILSSIGTFIYPYILKIAVEAIESNLPFKQLILRILIIVTIAFIIYTIRSVIESLMWHRIDKLGILLQKDLAVSSLDLDYEQFERPETQDAYEKATRGLNSYNGLVGLLDNGFYTLSYILSFFIACAIITSVNYLLVLAIIFLAFIKLLLNNYDQKKNKSDFTDKLPTIWRKISYCDRSSRNLTFGKDLRIYNMNEFINDERSKEINNYCVLNKKNLIRSYIINTIINILGILDEIFLYGFMIYEVIYHNMLIATFTFMVASVRNMTRSIERVIEYHGRLLNTSLRVNDYRLFMKMAVYEKGTEMFTDTGKLKIEFSHVSYSYYMQEGYALHDVSFIINPGEKVALVGFNGAGKTTLIKLICGLYHPTEGQIFINDVDIETLSRKSLYNLISPVFQDTINYALDIQENIAMEVTSKLDNEEEQTKLNNVIELVGLKEKINELPNRAKTVITRELEDTGIELSGGENQKLSLARAIYKHSKIMILDEPTSAMDAIGEYNLYNNFKQMIGDSTAIFISHRLSSTKFCERIIFLEEGKLIESGNHDELMAYESHYKKLFDMQAEYYKDGKQDEENN